MKTIKLKLSNISFLQAVFSALFAATLVAGRHISYSMYAESTMENLRVYDFHLLDLVMWIVCTCIVYLLATGVEKILEMLRENIWNTETKVSGKRTIFLFVGITAVLMVFWIPYMMSYWPGGIYSDTVDSITLALHKAPMDNHNPVLYTLLWRFCFWITGAFRDAGEYPGLKLMTVGQSLILAAALAGFVTYFYHKGLKKRIILLFTCIFAIFPMYPFYGISLWKDTIFSIVVFVYSIILYDIFVGNRCLEKKSPEQENLSALQLCLLGVGTFLIIFLRNNGIYVAAFASIVTVLVILGQKKKKIAAQLSILWGSILVVSIIIQGPVYSAKGWNIDSKRESMGIPIQQVAYILSSGVEPEEADLEVLETIMPMENWIGLYNPIVTDTIKFDPSFNVVYFEEHAGEFMKTYFHLIGQHPVMAVKAYMLQTMGFWDVTKSSSTAYICNFHFGNVEYFMSDYFDYYLDISFHKLVNPSHYMSAAIFVWIALYTLFLTIKRRNPAGMLVVLPAMGLWLSIMVAVPVAFSFRYIYSLFLCAPLYLLVGCGKTAD